MDGWVGSLYSQIELLSLLYNEMKEPLAYSNVVYLLKNVYHYQIYKNGSVHIIVPSYWVFQSDLDGMSK